MTKEESRKWEVERKKLAVAVGRKESLALVKGHWFIGYGVNGE